MRRIASAVLLALLLAAPARAVQPNEQLADPKLEARALKISSQLRCVVCQNQTIDDSDAALAHDLRVILRERLSAGDTDAEAVAFIVKRYGHYVLLRPPFEPWTLVLWLGPLGLLIGGGASLALFLIRREGNLPSAATTLSLEDQAEVQRILKTPENA